MQRTQNKNTELLKSMLEVELAKNKRNQGLVSFSNAFVRVELVATLKVG